MGRFFHHVGTFLLLAASALLIITTITAPVIKHLSILYVSKGQSASISYGTFGYCTQGVASQGNGGNQYCSNSMIGYDAVGVLTSIDNTQLGTAQRDTVNNLTRAMILHPIAAVLAFLACLISAGSGVIGSVLGSGIAFIACLVTLVIMAIDLAIFGVIRNHVNSDGNGNYAEYSTGMWTCIAAAASLFLGSMIVLFTCCSARHVRERKRKRRGWFR